MPNSPRQIDNSSVVSIFKKMETMLVSIEDIQYNTSVVITSIQDTLKNSIQLELKKQTGVLISIAQKLNDRSKEKLNVKELYDPTTQELIKHTGLLTTIAHELNIKTKKNIKMENDNSPFIDSITRLINSLNNITPKRVKDVETIFISIINLVTKFNNMKDVHKTINGIGIAISQLVLMFIAITPILILASPAIWMFRKISQSLVDFVESLVYMTKHIVRMWIATKIFTASLKWLIEGIKNIYEDEKNKEALEFLKTIGGKILSFVIGLVITFLLAPAMLIGAYVFGKSIMILTKTLSNITPEQTTQIELLTGIGKSVIMYALGMSLIAILAVPVLLGAVVIGSSIKIMFLIIGKHANDIEKLPKLSIDLKSLLSVMTKLAISLPLMSSMLISSVIFGLAIAAIALGISVFNKSVTPESEEKLKNIGLALLLFGIEIAIASWIVFASMLPIITLTFSLLFLSAVIFGIGKFEKEINDGIDSLKKMAKGLLIFGSVIVAISYMFKTIGNLNVLASVGILVLTAAAMLLIIKFFPDSSKSKNFTKSAGWIALGLLLISTSLVVSTVIMNMIPQKSILISLAIIAGASVLFGMIGIFDKEITKGAKAMLWVGGALIVISIGLYILGLVTINPASLAVATGVIIGLAVMMYYAGKRASQIILGSLAMTIAGVALIVISKGLEMFAKSGLTKDDAILLGLSVVGLGVAMTAAGAGPVPVFIALGSAAMIVAGVALMSISTGLEMFAKSGFTEDNAIVLGLSVVGLGVAMAAAGAGALLIASGAVAMGLAGVALMSISTGLEIFAKSGFTKDNSEDLVSALESTATKFAKFGFLSIPITAGSVAMGLAGLALQRITSSFSDFKKSGFSIEDGENLEGAIALVISAFSIISDKKKQKELGIDINPLTLAIGIASLSGVGNVLSSLAQGVQSWANLEVNEWQVINPGTTKAQLVIKSRRKLTDSDFSNAANGMSKVITAMAAPFAAVGKAEMGMATGDSVVDFVFGGNFVSKGISALAGIGDTLSSLAQGINAWGNMTFLEFEVVNAGTKKAKLVPKGFKPINIDGAISNITTVIAALTSPFAKVGREDDDWGFGSGHITRGVNAFASVGNTLSSLAAGIAAWSNMTYTEYEIIGGGTKNAKLVPKKITPIGDTKLATDNMGIVIAALASTFRKIGSDDDGWGWSDGSITKGVNAVTGIANIISSIAKTVSSFASGQFVTNTVVNGKIVPTGSTPFNPTSLQKVAYTISTLLSTFTIGMIRVGKLVSKYENDIELAVLIMPKVNAMIGETVKIANNWSTVKNGETIGTSINSLLMNIIKVFNDKTNPNVNRSLAYMNVFTNNITKISASDKGIISVAKNSKVIAQSMKLTKDAINGMDLKKLTLTDSLMKSLAVIAKNPEAMARAVEGGINKAFESLSNELKNLAQQTKQGSENVAAAVKETSTTSTSTQKTPTVNPKSGLLDILDNKNNKETVKENGGLTTKELNSHLKDSMTQDFIAALNAVTVKVKVMPGYGS